MVDRSEYKALEERVNTLEALLASDYAIEEGEYDNDQDERAIYDTVQSFSAGIKRLRREMVSKVHHVRREIREHSGDIKKIKKALDILCKVLGSTSIMEGLGSEAESICSLITSINMRISTIERQLQESN